MLRPVTYRPPQLLHKPAPPLSHLIPSSIHLLQQHLLSACCVPGMGDFWKEVMSVLEGMSVLAKLS